MKFQILLAGFGLVFLLQSPLVLAISCEFISSANYNTCLEILKSNLSDYEKEALISNLEYNNKFFPDHEFVFNLNNNIVIKSAPEGVEVINKDFIRNAWVDIFAIMPSVLYNESLFVSEKASVFTGFNYEVNLPSNYDSSSYPKTKNGDCKTQYFLEEERTEINIYVQNKYFGNGDFIDVLISSDSEIKAELNILIDVNIRHYVWNRYCSSRRADGSCRRYSESCDYKNTENKIEKLKIFDSLFVKRDNNILSANVFPVSAYSGTTTLKIESLDSVEVKFESSEYAFYKYVYSIEYSKPPYYISTLKAQNYNQEKLSNLFKNGENLVVTNPKNCKIKTFDFFKIIEKSCEEVGGNIEFFIKTDKLKYKEGEEIKINIYPADISVEISYAGEKKKVIGSTTFIAVYNSNQIIATQGDFKAEKIIYISNRAKILLLWNLIIFTFLNYCLLIVIKKYARRIT
jgi:hypothetical protein